jgi:hypothetical protein
VRRLTLGQSHLQGLLLTFEDPALEAAYRQHTARISFNADWGLYALSFSLWTFMWLMLYKAGEQRAVWAAGNAVMCFSTLLFMR